MFYADIVIQIWYIASLFNACTLNLLQGIWLLSPISLQKRKSNFVQWIKPTACLTLALYTTAWILLLSTHKGHWLLSPAPQWCPCAEMDLHWTLCSTAPGLGGTTWEDVIIQSISPARWTTGARWWERVKRCDSPRCDGRLPYNQTYTSKL